MIKKVFISGPMTGYPNSNKEAFDEAEKILKEAGFAVFNPAKMDLTYGFTEQDIASIDLSALLRCDYIYQLDGWENSIGATGEWQAASWAKMERINKSWLDWYIEEKRKRNDGRNE